MQAPSRMNIEQNLAVNSFLLCNVLAKQARRLGKLLPGRRIAELITVAMKDCANYEIVLELGADIPHIVRTEAMQIGRLTRRLESSVASSPDAREGNQDSDVVSTVQQDAKEGEPAGKGSLPVESADGSLGSVDSAIDSVNSRRIYLTFRGHFQ